MCTGVWGVYMVTDLPGVWAQASTEGFCVVAGGSGEVSIAPPGEITVQQKQNVVKCKTTLGMLGTLV